MAGNTNDQTRGDELQALVTAFAEATLNEPGEKPLPMATDDADEVIRAQLTENTGSHFLDSGSAYGRHHEVNRDNPPWERPSYDVDRGYVVENVYDYMASHLGRTRACVSLEAALYAYGYSDDRKRDAWLRCAEDFGDALLDGQFSAPMLEALGLPEPMVDDVLGIQAEFGPGGDPYASHEPGDGTTTWNTYNDEWHALSQVLQGTNLGGPYAKYVMMQVHQGCDVRGGYSSPRVYETFDGWIPSEFYYRCERCEWEDAESCVYGDDSLIYQRTIDPFELEEEGLLDEGDEEHPAIRSAYSAEGVDGAVFHECDDGGLGYVGVM